jgi:DNA-directed RNA polymerase subunit RPC12/RpoP
MSFPIKVCVVCEEEFELRPDKPGFANRCPKCSAPEADKPVAKERMDSDTLKSVREANAARRQAIKDLLYSRK